MIVGLSPLNDLPGVLAAVNIPVQAVGGLSIDQAIQTLEMGAGCGYQAAILGVLSKQVFAVERIAPLLARARDNLKQLKLSHIRLKHADGNLGLPEAAPFDTIILAAAAADVPQMLLGQLAPGGRLVMPLGNAEQVISLVERTEDGFVESKFDAVRFVPLLPGVE